MRIRITLEPEVPLDLPVHYGGLLQGFIYKQIEPHLAAWLHDEAYRTAARTYRMFCFSRLNPADGSRYRLAAGRIRYDGAASFTLASIDNDLLRSLAEHLLKAPEVHLGRHPCTVRGVEVLKKPEPDFNRPIRFRALSPITVYSTLRHGDGRKKTYYYSPFEDDWHEQLRGNLAHKARALGWDAANHGALAQTSFRPVRVSQKDQKIIRYKGTVIKGWTGTYEACGLPQGFFELAYDAGLGAKNAQGFGMVEVE